MERWAQEPAPLQFGGGASIKPGVLTDEGKLYRQAHLLRMTKLSSPSSPTA
jgi:hypothetical protein